MLRNTQKPSSYQAHENINTSDEQLAALSQGLRCPNSRVLLATVLVKVIYHGKSLILLACLNSGAMATFISYRIAQFTRGKALAYSKIPTRGFLYFSQVTQAYIINNLLS